MMSLSVFDSGCGLPSIDIKSLQMMSYARFTKMKVEFVKRTFKPYTGYDLPELNCEKGRITDLDDYFEYLKFEASDDSNLGKLDKKYYPYLNLLQETLKPCLLNTFWINNMNYSEKIRGLYAKASCFPFNYLVPHHLRSRAIDYLDNVYPAKCRGKYFDVELLEKAKSVIKLLSNELSDSKYFNETKPNEIDAIIFGYLAIILKIELPGLNNLQQYLKEHKNLVHYVNRILNEYFPEEVEKEKKDNKVKVKDETAKFESASVKSIITFTVIMISSNILYILYLLATNRLEIVVEEEDSDDEED